MADFSITVSDSTKTSNRLLWDGIVRANDGTIAQEAVADQIIGRLSRETGLPASLLHVHVTEIVPHLSPDLVVNREYVA